MIRLRKVKKLRRARVGRKERGNGGGNFGIITLLEPSRLRKGRSAMKISSKLEEAVNKQINAEFYSAYLYLGMSSRCAETNLKGIAHWFYVQSQEEMTHAIKFYRFLLDRGGRPVMPAVEGVRTDWKDPLEMFQAAYAHEQKVTAMINGIADIALAERDHATASMLNWFVDEQVEEEANASEIAEKLRLIGSSKDGLFMLDKELSVRVFVDRTQPAGGAQA